MKKNKKPLGLRVLHRMVTVCRKTGDKLFDFTYHRYCWECGKRLPRNAIQCGHIARVCSKECEDVYLPF